MRYEGCVVSNFIIQALEEENLRVYGSGSQTRFFCFVSDLIDGLIKLFVTSKEIIGPINLENPKPTTMIESASKNYFYEIFILRARASPFARR